MSARICWVTTSVLLVGLVVAVPSRVDGQTDCNGNDIRDTDEVAQGLTEDCNGNGLPDECEVNQPSYGEDQEFPLASTPRDGATADLDGDGQPDFIVVSRRIGFASEGVLVVHREGGQLQSTPLPFPDDFRRLQVVDIDGDGDQDLVSAHRDFVYVQINLGPGIFLDPEAFAPPSPARVETLAAADLDGDGLPEVIGASSATDQLVVFRSTGAGQLAPGVQVPAGDAPAELGVGDFDGDGDQDVAVVHRNADEVGIYTADGNGDLFLATAFPLQSTRPFNLDVADMNRDGRSDIVTMGAGVLEVLLQEEGGGFAESVSYAARGSDLRVSDFDRDGAPDVAVSITGREVSIRFNDGSGKLNVLREILSGLVPGILLADDHDLDGQIDLAYVDPSRDATLHILSAGEAGRLTMQRVDIPLTGCADSRGCRPHGGTSGDFNGDGYTDVLVSNTHPGSFSYLENDGLGNLELLRSERFGGEHPQSATAGDIDGDSDVDALTADNLDHRLYVHVNMGDGTFAPPVRYPVGMGAINVRLFDFDADGFLDALTANQSSNNVSVLFNQGDGTFAAGRARDYPVRGAPKSAEGADFNGDGLGDIVAGNSGAARVTVFLGEAGRSFGLRKDYALSHAAHHVAVGDLDGDGDVDIAAALLSGNAVGILPNRGDGTFDVGTSVPLGVSPYSSTVLDLDGNGLLDVVTGNETSNSVSIVLSEGGGEFAPPLNFASGLGLRFILPGDFENDGDLDFATSNRGGNSVTALYQESAGEVADFLERVCTPADFQGLSAASGGAQGERFVKFLLPARSDDPDLLPAIFQNSSRYELHQDFLAEVFPDRFPALTTEDYTRLVGRRATRDYFVGAIRRVPPRLPGALRGPEELLFGFSVFADFRDGAEALSEAEVTALYERLRSAFSLERLVYAPTQRDARRQAGEWESLPVYLESSAPAIAFEAYTRGVGYGRVRRLSAEAFAEANELGQFGFQDILVLEEAPRDIEGVSAGIVTAQRQGELSHVAVRTARRGTPNAFVRDAVAVFEPYDGRLVRLEVTATGYSVDEATAEEAEQFWTESRPQLSALPAIDESFTELPTLAEIALQEQEGAGIEARFGGKASNLARLQTILVPPQDRYRMRAFAIPVHYYMQFLRSNRMPSALDAAREVTYEQYIEELAGAPELRSDSRRRFAALAALRDHMDDDSVVDAELVRRLAARVEEVFQSTVDRVRFRSSSNVEDAIEFNGAGLYDSTSVCVQDDLDGDDDGPSHCDSERENERRIERGLRKVWQSVWNFRAYEERAFYGMDQTQVAMGILVNQSFVDEQVNGVAFTGNPSNGRDRRYVVTAQPGEESVVSPDPGIVAEKDLIEMTTDGAVARIVRATASSLVPEGVHVLDDDRLRELGELLWRIDRDLPVELGTRDRREILFDVEFKVTADAELIPKQVRPFLLSDPGPPPPTFSVVVPDGLFCGVFQIDRGLDAEHELKSQLRLSAGSVELPTVVESFTLNLVEGFSVGPAREEAEALDSGLMQVRRFPGAGGRTTYSFEYEQPFVLGSGESCVLTLGPLNYVADGDQLLFGPDDLAAALFAEESFLSLSLPEREGVTEVRYLPCDFGDLPRWENRWRTDDGFFALEERFLMHPTETGPAQLVAADLTVAGQRREVVSYWDLVYTAARHNERVSYRVVLASPLRVPGVEGEVHAVDLVTPESRENVRAAVHYLDADFEHLVSATVAAFAREESASFQRGDNDADGRRTITDALSLLRFLFDGAALGGCADAADVNDDGRLNLVDPIDLLEHVVRGGPEPAAPFATCGPDRTLDRLGCEEFPACQ